MMRRWLVALGLCFGLVMGCSDDEQADEQSESTEQTEEVEEVEPSAAQVPVAEDFADEAESEVTEDNYEEQLDHLAEEIESESD